MPSRLAAMVATETAPPERLFTPPPPPATSLAYEINSATKDVHTELNKLITARIPLALPPHADSPTLFLQGIHVFSSIYCAFEESWQDLIKIHASSSSPSPTSGSLDTSDPQSLAQSRLISSLACIIPSPLWRTARIREDIRYLQSTTGTAHLPDLSASDDLVRLRTHIASATSAKPHLLLAYAWVMYMAIFSGGRWIRSELRHAGRGFWDCTTSPPSPSTTTSTPTDPAPLVPTSSDDDSGFTLFSFPDTPDDGARLKTTFKQRFTEIDEQLTAAQRTEIADEARLIFALCRELVHALDARCGTDPALMHASTSAKPRDSSKATSKQAGSPKKAGPFKPGSWGERMQKYMPREEAGGNPTNLPGTFMTEGLGAWEALAAIVLGLGMWLGLRYVGVIGGLDAVIGGPGTA